jgi:Asp-tRNA(Asn)/Glu-tRNA(Gln) amidotransferase C subunit
MASSLRKKILCSKCDKAGVLSCHGCKKDFCYVHVTKHREELNKQMELIITKRDQLQEIIVEHKAKPDCHPLIEQIDQWEQQSIIKIRQTAHETRRKLFNLLEICRTEVTDTLSHFTQELNRARKDDDYVETDLKEWISKLKQLKKDLFAAQKIRFGQDNDGNTLISKIFIDDTTREYFEHITGDIEILDDGKVIVHGQSNSNAIARGTGEYAVGQYQYRFKMEQLSTNHGFYFGIVSKNTSNQSILRAIPTTHNLHRTSRILVTPGFYCKDEDENGFFYLNKIDFNVKMNDTLELFIDCDQRKIRLKHEQSQHQQEAFVNINKCPFPWQFFVCLSCAGDRILLY